jgi:hypothetical protein
MTVDLATAIATLTATSGAELQALITATYGISQTTTGLLAWIEGVLERPLRSADLDRPKLAVLRRTNGRIEARAET